MPIKIILPSELANSPPYVTMWGHAASVPIANESTIKVALKDSAQLPTSFVDGLKSGFEMPQGLLDKLDNQHPATFTQGFLASVKEAAASYPTAATGEDKYDLEIAFNTLASCHSSINQSPADSDPNEAEQRVGIDQMMRLVWWVSSKKMEIFDVRIEQPLCIQASSARLDLRISKAATANLLVVSAHPGNLEWADVSLWQPTISLGQMLQGTWRDTLTDLNVPITTPMFSGEYGFKSARKNVYQLYFDLSTTLLQQRSLGMPPHEAVGFTSADGIFKLYSLHWLQPDDTVRNKPVFYFQEHEDILFDLRKPIDILRCYTFLCRLRNHILQTVYTDFVKLELKTVLDSIAKYSWRAADPNGEAQVQNELDSVKNKDEDGERSDSVEDEEGRPSEDSMDLSSDYVPMWDVQRVEWEMERARYKGRLSASGDSIPLTEEVVKELPS